MKLLKRNFKWSTMCDEVDKIRSKKLQRKHEIEFKTLDETMNLSREWIHNINAHLFRVELMSNRSIIL
jgi:DNA-binding Lrp family transcriptional regulator